MAKYKVIFEGPNRENYSIIDFPSLSNILEFARYWETDPPLFATKVVAITRVESEKEKVTNDSRS